MSKKSALYFLLLTLLGGHLALADEQTRRVQEELRKRHLFFTDIDGRDTIDYSVALRRYQERQGFPATGMADNQTLNSLGIGEPVPPAEGTTELPDVPVLKSDAALREQARAANPAPLKISAPTEATKADIRRFVRKYLEACQSPNPQDELAFFADRVDYFDHGVVDHAYIQNELAVYDQRWPNRKYSMEDSIHVAKDGAITVRTRFQLANPLRARKAGGKTDETFGLTRRGDSGLQIVSIKETRVRRPWRRRRANPADAIGRSVHKVFHSIFR